MIARLVTPLACILIATGAQAATPREILTDIAFTPRDKAATLARIELAASAARTTLAHQPQDREARMSLAMATSYRAKLTRNRGDALVARGQFEALASSAPNDAEAQAALGSWHVSSIIGLGAFMARAAIGARKADGIAALDRSVRLGGDRAMFPALDGLMRLALDPGDVTGLQLVRRAAQGSTPTPLDQAMRRKAAEVLASGASGNRLQTLARGAVPLGWVN
ncbi:MAG: hypothetical protein ABIS14_06715 [Sphingomonas sp.]